MTRIAQQVSRAIRILRGNRDESARASHLVVEKDLLMTYERALLGQAEREKYFQSTFFERKTMSTKTAFKRVALVAAAALAIGGISAVSAQATPTTPTGGAIFAIDNYLAAQSSSTAETATQIAGVANFVTLNTALTTYFTISGGATTTGTTSGSTAAAGSFNVATPTAGTITVTGYTITGGAAATTASSTVTITVVASVPGTVYASATVLGSASTLAGLVGTSATINAASDAAFAVTAPAGASNVANFSVTQADANAVPLSSGNYKVVTATVTNGLLLATNNLGTIGNTATTYLSGTPTGAVNFSLSGIAGLAGTSTVTISVNGVVIKTYSAIFTGAAVKIVLTAVNPVVAVGTAPVTNITANTNALEVQEFDINNNAISANLGTISFTVGTTTVASVGASDIAGGTYLGGGTSGTHTSATAVGYQVNGLVAGTTTITAADSTGTLASNSVSVRVSSATPTSVVFSTDAAAYATGQAGTLTTTISDAAGTVPAGAYVVLTGQASASYALTVGSLPGLSPIGSITVDDSGVATTSFNAPLSDGTTTITGTAAATTITVTPASFTVASPSSDAANAATDAANEATDAANAATDAANAAADSADAATQAAQDAGDKADAALAAVTALSQQVTSVLAKIAGLAASLARIIKKVKA